MILSFKHKGLKLFFEDNDPSRLAPHHVEKIRLILYRLDEARTVEEMNVVGWNLHSLKGSFRNFFSVKVNGNFRIIFCFEDGNAFSVDYLDYH